MTTVQGRWSVTVALACALAPPAWRAGATTDLTGKWRVEHSPAQVEYVDLVHSAPTVTGVFPTLIRPDLAGYGAWDFAGTFSDPSLAGTLSFPAPAASGSLAASVFGGGVAFDGELEVQPASGPSSTARWRTAASASTAGTRRFVGFGTP